jgi:tetratricopeptide (TPR) repeat protein/DNA-binding CsgD family transcriptional regulator
LLFVVFNNSPLVAQNQKKLDSLNYLLETAKNDSLRIYLLVSISREYSSNNIPMSLEYSHKALELSEKTGNKILQAYALFNVGNSYFIQGLYEISTKYFYRYLEIMKETGNNKGMAYAQANLGSIRLQLKDYKLALDNYENALETFNKMAEEDEKSKPYSAIISIYNNLGIVSKELNQPDKAIEYYLRGISLARNTPGEHVILANLLNNLGSLYVNQGKTQEAFELMNEALNIRIENDDKTGQANSYRELATYFTKQNDIRKAINFLDLSLKMANEIGSISLQAEITGMLFEHYNNQHNADSALKYKILYTDVKEKLNEEATRKELAHLELTSQLQEKEKIREFEQKRKDLNYLMIGLTLILLLSILGLLYFLSHSRVRRLRLEKENINLASKNLELEKSNLMQELEIKNKELATNVMYQIQKNELIHEIGQKLQKLSYSISKSDQQLIIGIIKDLEKTQDSSIWNEFEVRFQQVHNDFYNKLNVINPELSLNDRRLCAFLRLNMTTKEICSITGQSIRSIEVARTRLRRKLDLTNSETGLIEFLSKL